MKKLPLALAFAAVLPASMAFAQQNMGDMKMMDMAKKPAASTRATHMATGVVKKLDAKVGVVTIAHEPIASLNWPAMTMGFLVKDRMLLDKFIVGKTVNFEFAQTDKGYLITSMK